MSTLYAIDFLPVVQNWPSQKRARGGEEGAALWREPVAAEEPPSLKVFFSIISWTKPQLTSSAAHDGPTSWKPFGPDGLHSPPLTNFVILHLLTVSKDHICTIFPLQPQCIQLIQRPAPLTPKANRTEIWVLHFTYPFHSWSTEVHPENKGLFVVGDFLVQEDSMLHLSQLPEWQLPASGCWWLWHQNFIFTKLPNNEIITNRREKVSAWSFSADLLQQEKGGQLNREDNSGIPSEKSLKSLHSTAGTSSKHTRNGFPKKLSAENPSDLSQG